MKRATLAILLVAATPVAATSDLAGQQDAAALMRQAFDPLVRGQFAEAVPLLEACRAAGVREGNRLAEGECTRGLARAAQARREWDVAERFYQQAHDALTVVNNHALLARNFGDRANFASILSRWEEVHRFYGEAADHFAQAGMIDQQAAALRGQTFASTVPVDDRLATISRAFDLVRTVKAPRIEAAILHQWGDLLYIRADYAASIEKTEAAVALMEGANDPAALGRALTSLGRLYRVHGAYDEAIAVYRRILPLQEAARDHLGVSQTLTMIGSATMMMGRFEESLSYHERSLRLAELHGSDRQIADHQSSVAYSLILLKRFAEAEPIILTALAASDDTPSQEGRMLGLLALIQSGLGRHQEALASVTRGLELVREGATVETQLAMLEHRSSVLHRLGDRAGALETLETAMSMIEQQRTKLAPSDFLKSSFTDVYQWLSSRTIDLLQAAGRSGDAMTMAEQARARAFLDLLATREAKSDQPVTPAGTASSDLTMRGGGDRASAVSAASPTGATIRDVAARLRSTVVSYWVSDDATYIFAMAPDGRVTSTRVAVSRGRLQQLVRRTWSMSPSSLKRRGGDTGEGDAAGVSGQDRALAYVTMRGGDALAPSGLESPAFRELYELLIRPVRASLPAAPNSLLTIIPHGPLFELSFAALSDTRGRYLLEDYRLHYAPSAATLDSTARRADSRTPERYMFLANPAIAPRVSSQPLPPLPGAEREVSAVTRLVGARASTVLSRATATEDAVRSMAGRYRAIHFATHGVVSSDKPLESFLALAPGTSSGGDGRLTAGEIYDLKLSADVVVLSACRAGGGKISGDGVVGLTRAFMATGTPSIVATLWDMADETAEVLLPRFYAEWAATGDKSQALRSAQLALLRDLRAKKVTVDSPFGRLPLPAAPALWANLVLIGEPK